MKNIICYSLLIPFAFFCSNACHAQKSHPESYVNTSNEISFNSSDDELNKVFTWAKKQALAYAFSGDVGGQWYEAGLPGREVYCMRDVSHQAMGAHFLGLASYTKNMLYHMAESISDSRDWCSLWEITRHGTPAIQDYLNDAEFWYNLPANFDILNCAFRMYELTGDLAYINDPVFLNFYKKTVYDYVRRWDLGIDKVMKRDRFMNNTPDNNRRFKESRGIPGYNEGDQDYTCSIDLLATELAAFESYARIQQLRCNDEEALAFYAKAKELKEFINDVWWDKENQQYYSYLDQHHVLHSVNSSYFQNPILYWCNAYITDTLKLESTVKKVVANIPYRQTSGIEGQSHLSETLYKYGQLETARKILLFVANHDDKRYPEASFSTIGAMVEGLMGIEMEIFPLEKSIATGGYQEQILSTQSRLTGKTKWAEINHVPIKRNDISVRHDGLTKTTITNNSGPQLQWKACFAGTYENLMLNGKPKKAKIEKLPVNGENISWLNVPIGPGETYTVEAPN